MYASYRLHKLDRMARAVNAGEGRVQAAPTSPSVRLPDRLKMTIKTLPKQLAIAKDAELAIKAIGKGPAAPKEAIDANGLKAFEDYARSLGISKIGYTEMPRELIFTGRSVAYAHAIVMVLEIPKGPVDAAPGDATQAAGIATYQHMGNVTNLLAEYLRGRGYAAEAGHPAIGPVLYTPLAMKAGLGSIGRHGLLITPEFGPRQRISALFTSIGNLPSTDSGDHAWIRDFCASCGNCVRRCPMHAIYEKPIAHADGRVSCIDGSRCTGCSICMRECSFNRLGYGKIKAAHRKKAGPRAALAASG